LLYARAWIELSALFPEATRIEINPQRVEVEGVSLLPLPVLAKVLEVLTKAWGNNAYLALTRGRSGHWPETHYRGWIDAAG